MEKFSAQAGWIGEDGRELDDAKDFNTQAEALAWLDDYHTGREMREIWQGRRLVAALSPNSQEENDAFQLACLEEDAEFFSKRSR